MTRQHFQYKELLFPPVCRAAYSDRTAWLMAEISSLAYLEFEKSADELNALKVELAKAEFELVSSPFNVGGTQAFLAKRDKDRMAVLAFRGTQIKGFALETFFDGFSDLYATFYKNAHGVKIHNGFLLAFQNIEKNIRAALDGIKDCALYVTGHSLGGALALIATRSINTNNLAACYTFGSPKVGNEEFDDIIKAPIYRVVNAWDLVPFLPFTWIMWPIFKLAAKKITNEKLKMICDDFKDYRNHGDLRFLTDEAEAKVLTEYSELGRSIQLICHTFSESRDIGVRDHSIDIYCDKLEQWALKRLKV